jgi:hypothetical protein
MSPETPRWPPLDGDGRLVWPTNHDERVFLARRLLGQALVETMDYYIKEATDFASNPTADRHFEIENYFSCTDRAYRGCFALMASKQREITLHLIRQFVSGVLVCSLTRLDRFGLAEVRIALVGHDRDGQPIDVPSTSPDNLSNAWRNSASTLPHSRMT